MMEFLAFFASVWKFWGGTPKRILLLANFADFESCTCFYKN